MQVFQPSNQIKLTNVSVVRLKKGGKRFEIACYKNKVREWRTGVETDLSEVLQSESVFINVSKGQVARSGDFEKAFNTIDQSKVVLEILTKGELQVGEKERAHELEGLRKEVAVKVASMCVDPQTGRPHTVSMIEKAMEAIHFNLNASKSAKSQALDVIKTLSSSPDVISLSRSQMKVRITMPSKDGKRLRPSIAPRLSEIEEEDWTEQWELVAMIDPGQFKVINEILQEELQGRGKLETLSFGVQSTEGEERLE